jgi:hypothetical protein
MTTFGDRPLPAVLLSVAVALAVGSCGGSSDGDTDGGAKTQDAVNTESERQLRTLVSDVSRALETGDGDLGCARMSRAAREQFAGLVRPAGDGRPSCSAGFRRYVSQGQLTEDLHPKVLDVRVAGAEATVVARNAKGESVRAAAVKEGGQWKLEEYFRD